VLGTILSSFIYRCRWVYDGMKATHFLIHLRIWHLFYATLYLLSSTIFCGLIIWLWCASLWNVNEIYVAPSTPNTYCTAFCSCFQAYFIILISNLHYCTNHMPHVLGRTNPSSAWTQKGSNSSPKNNIPIFL